MQIFKKIMQLALGLSVTATLLISNVSIGAVSSGADAIRDQYRQYNEAQDESARARGSREPSPFVNRGSLSHFQQSNGSRQGQFAKHSMTKKSYIIMTHSSR